MNNPHPNEPEPQPRLTLRDTLRKAVTEARAIIEASRSVTGRPRQIETGAMLAAAFAIVIALAAVQHLDRPLTVAAIAVGAAIPLLAVDFTVASLDFEPGLPGFPVNVMKIAAFAVCEALGFLGVAVGLTAVLWHLASAAAIALFVGVGLALLAPGLVLGMIILWLVVLFRRATSKGGAVDVNELVRNSWFLSLFAPRANKPTEPHATQQTDMDP